MRFDEVAEVNGVYEVDVELDGRLRAVCVGSTRRHSHGSIGERHQHSALHDAASVLVLGFGQKADPEGFPVLPFPDRANQAEEAIVGLLSPPGLLKLGC
jgi:hypothetical protein